MPVVFERSLTDPVARIEGHESTVDAALTAAFRRNAAEAP